MNSLQTTSIEFDENEKASDYEEIKTQNAPGNQIIFKILMEKSSIENLWSDWDAWGDWDR